MFITLSLGHSASQNKNEYLTSQSYLLKWIYLSDLYFGWHELEFYFSKIYCNILMFLITVNSNYCYEKA